MRAPRSRPSDVGPETHCFTIIKESAEEKRALPTRFHDSGRPLVIDDEANFRKLVSSALTSFTVVEASDGQEALAMVQEDELDLVITDIRMPNMDGFGLLQNLRAEFPLLPVVAVSRYLEDDDVRDHEFDEVIEKPFGAKDLRDLAEQMVTQKNSDSAG